MSKTNRRMMAVAFLGTVALGVSLSGWMRASAAEDQAQKTEAKQADLATQLIGTWKLEEASRPGSPSGIGTRLKFFTGTHWCVVQPDPDTGVVVFQHGGRYELDGTKLETQHDFAGESTKALIGRVTTLELQIDGDTLKQTDAAGVFNETWKRVK